MSQLTDPTFERTTALRMMKEVRDRFYKLLVEHPMDRESIDVNRAELVEAIEELDDAMAEALRAFHAADLTEATQ